MRSHAPTILSTNKAATAGYESLKQAYVLHMTLRNLTPLSIRQNEQALRLFIGWLQSIEIYSIHRVNRQTIERYKVELMTHRTRRGTRLSFNTVRGRLFILENWFTWMRRKGWVATNPLVGLQVPPLIRYLPRGIMTVDEIRAVMNQPDLKTLIGYRDRTMMEVLYSTGMRAAEICKIEVGDVDLEKKVACVRLGKGRKDRNVPLSTPCCHFLERYIRKVRPELALGIKPSGNSWLKKYRTGGKRLFLSSYGGPMGAIWLGEVMRRYLLKAGITRPMSPVHGFRHSVATHLMESGMDVRYVQAFLGHSNINTTTIYTHVAREPLHGHLKKYHPRAERGEFKPFVAGEEYHA